MKQRLKRVLAWAVAGLVLSVIGVLALAQAVWPLALIMLLSLGYCSIKG